MALAGLAYIISLLWLIIHVIHRFRHSRSRQSVSGILPSSSGSGRRRGLANVKVELRHVHLQVDSTAFNDAHDRLAMTFSKGRHALRKRVAVAFYDFGSACGGLGMLAGLYLTASTLLWSLRPFFEPQSPPGLGTTLTKRDFTDIDIAPHSIPVDASRNAPVQLLLPGLTLPLSHLPILVLALFVCQIIHEAGHAITAAMESLPLLSVGASLTLILPSAYVSLSSSGVDSLSPRARLRVLSSGAFHNLVLYILVFSLSWLSLGALLWPILGYRDMRASGRVVISVSETSPLVAFLPLGAVITRLDDTSLASIDPTQDLWAEYLSEPTAAQHTGDLGWCADASWYESLPLDCCSASGTRANVSCFVAGTLERCAPTLNILQPADDNARRCAAAADCHAGALCIALRGDQLVTRIAFHAGYREETVVWSGPRAELLEDVDIGVFLPRWSFLPLWLPSLIAIVFEYVATLSLSLYLFNLLPLPRLDGSQLLDALAELAQAQLSKSRDSTAFGDAELGAAGRVGMVSAPAWSLRYRRLKKGVQAAIGTMLGVTMLLAVWRAL